MVTARSGSFLEYTRAQCNGNGCPTRSCTMASPLIRHPLAARVRFPAGDRCKAVTCTTAQALSTPLQTAGYAMVSVLWVYRWRTALGCPLAVLSHIHALVNETKTLDHGGQWHSDSYCPGRLP